MRTTTSITIGLTAALCLGVFFWQRSSIKALSAEAESLSAKMTADLSEEAVGERPVTAMITTKRPEVESLPTEERLERLKTLLEKSFEDAVPAVLSELEGCDVDQLLELVKGMSSEPKLQVLLLQIVATEEDPVRMLTFLEESEGLETWVRSEMRVVALKEIAKSDPQLALDKMEWEGITGRERASAQGIIGQALLRSDVKAALALMLQVDPNSYMPGVSTLVKDAVVGEKDPQVADNLWSEANQIEPGKLRNDLLKGLLDAELRMGGGVAVDEAFQDIELQQDERNALVEGVASEFGFGQMEPSWALDFMNRQATGEIRDESMASSVRLWAQKDFDAAGTWLGAQPASPLRDKMIGAFSRQISIVDREAAIAWAREIGDEQLTQSVLKDIAARTGKPVEN